MAAGSPEDPGDEPGVALSRQQLTAIADELVEQAAAIRRQWAELAEVLGGSDQVERRRAPRAGEQGPGATPRQTIRLVAIDMMLAGDSREDIAVYLREAFPGEDASGVVEAVFREFAG
jgi:hypothetical protein